MYVDEFKPLSDIFSQEEQDAIKKICKVLKSGELKRIVYEDLDGEWILSLKQDEEITAFQNDFLMK